MSPAFKKYLDPASYLHRWKKMQRSRKVGRLEKRKTAGAVFTPLWEVGPGTGSIKNEVFVGAFGIAADMPVNWMKDVPGDLVFPSRRIDRIKMSEYYDRGFDVKYPWELSRFIFGSQLACSYAQPGNRSAYTRFRELVLDWIRGNPFLRGVNWMCTMDVAIRATNWILAANVFAGEIARDEEFREKFSASLVQHGMYIHAFPEVYPGNHSTNHTTADYLGLLYVSGALPDHPEACRWQQAAVDGLLGCMDYQVYPDGGSFEASAGYHRLVTELFGLGALFCLNRGIGLPDSYYTRLQAMFAFLFAICDTRGNAPLFGDNDSGTLLQLDFARNQNYAYMQAFYRQLFTAAPAGQPDETEAPEASPPSGDPFLCLMPAAPKLHSAGPGANGLRAKEWKLLSHSGLMAFRNGKLSGSVHFLPIGQKGRGGHNHLDTGSFVLFHDGSPVVVDPGTYTYTRDFAMRNCYRGHSCHNTVIPSDIGDEDFRTDRLFELDPYARILEHNLEDEHTFTLSYTLLDHPHPIRREFRLEEGVLEVRDSTRGAFRVKLHLAPGVDILEDRPGFIRTSLFTLSFDPGREYVLGEYGFADTYQSMKRSRRLRIYAESQASMRIEFNNGSGNGHDPR